MKSMVADVNFFQISYEGDYCENNCPNLKGGRCDFFSKRIGEILYNDIGIHRLQECVTAEELAKKILKNN